MPVVVGNENLPCAADLPHLRFWTTDPVCECLKSPQVLWIQLFTAARPTNNDSSLPRF